MCERTSKFFSLTRPTINDWWSQQRRSHNTFSSSRLLARSPSRSICMSFVCENEMRCVLSGIINIAFQVLLILWMLVWPKYAGKRTKRSRLEGHGSIFDVVSPIATAAPTVVICLRQREKRVGDEKLLKHPTQTLRKRGREREGDHHHQRAN